MDQDAKSVPFRFVRSRRPKPSILESVVMKNQISGTAWLVYALTLSPSVMRAHEPSIGAFQVRDIAFSSSNIQLKATLLLPQTAGKVPGVVLVHGSGNSDRSNPWTSAYANALVTRGIAVLHPDKRGCGQSGGDWRTSSMVDFALDARAALNALRNEPGLDPERLGLIGFSQGGDVLPLAAAKDTHISFTVDISGSVVPMAEQITDEVELSAVRAGCSQAQIDLLLQLNEKGLRFASSGLDSDWADYDHSLVLAKEGELRGSPVLERFPGRRDHPALGQVRHILSYDPMVFWKEVAAPKLFVFGGHDTQVRVDKSLRRLQAELTKESNYSFLLFNSNGHALYREDLCDFLARWVKDVGKP